MNKIFKKNEVAFSIILIVIYVVGTSIAEAVSENLGIAKLVPAIFHVLFTVVVLAWISKNGLLEKYGLILPKYKLKKAWFFIPLLFVACSGLVGGFQINYSLSESVLFVISMLCVGFLEEIIFRGFLFKAMAKNNVKAAIIVSSITFGIGHIVNLLNGQDIFRTCMQIVFAVAVGFVLVGLFYKGKSLIPCIIFHSLNNSLSAFEKSNAQVAEMFSLTEMQFEGIMVSILVLVLAIYGIFIMKKSGISEEKDGTKNYSDICK